MPRKARSAFTSNNQVTPKIKNCLKCQKPFTFQGLFICPKCTKTNDSQNFSKREQQWLKSEATLSDLREQDKLF